MGAWGELAFDNDIANDWAYGLEEVDDLSLVESASELRDVWDDARGDGWRSAVADLRRRLAA